MLGAVLLGLLDALLLRVAGLLLARLERIVGGGMICLAATQQAMGSQEQPPSARRREPAEVRERVRRSKRVASMQVWLLVECDLTSLPPSFQHGLLDSRAPP
jgi:hypothetical protein